MTTPSDAPMCCQALFAVLFGAPSASVEAHSVRPCRGPLVPRGRAERAPTTLSNIVHFFKSTVTKQLGFSLWQKSFHDHIIRNQADYNRVYEYIDHNPEQWEEDEFFSPEQEATPCSTV